MRRTAALVLILASVSAAACTPLRGHQGYIVDVDLVNSVQPGVDNRQTVAQTLGQPTVAGQFGDRQWYYVARDTRNLAFNNPRPSSQITIRVSFDAAGTVSNIDRMGLEQVVAINPSNKKTPTLGRERGFFSDLFGNIGTVGTMGGGAGGGGSDGP
ncbi:outer membrane protein assembly factor BamE [Sphingomonas sp. RS2018]